MNHLSEPQGSQIVIVTPWLRSGGGSSRGFLDKQLHLIQSRRTRKKLQFTKTHLLWCCLLFPFFFRQRLRKWGSDCRLYRNMASPQGIFSCFVSKQAS